MLMSDKEGEHMYRCYIKARKRIRLITVALGDISARLQGAKVE
jgi:hypothetical protein